MSADGDTPIERARRLAKAPLKRRFYSRATVEEGEGGFRVLLDERPIRTPGKALLLLPAQALAQAIAEEWQAQEADIDPAAMPLTRLANTVLDRVARSRKGVIDEIVAYAGSDLLCYRAEEPEGLVARQCDLWDPILAWAAAEYGIRLVCVAGIMPRAQDEEVLSKFRQQIENEDDFVLGALADMAALMGSALLALAVLRGRLTAKAGWAAAHVDEDWQISQWGEDSEAASRRAARFADMQAAARMAAMVARARRSPRRIGRFPITR